MRTLFQYPVKAVFNLAINCNRIKRNPMEAWRKARTHKRRVALTRKEIWQIREAAAPHLRWIIDCAWNFGARPGPSELLALKWSDVDWEKRQVRMPSSKTFRKTGEDHRIIAIPTKFFNKFKEASKYTKSGYVCEFRGKPVNSVSRAFKTACRKAGIDTNARLYDLRHMSITESLANGAQPIALAKKSGHTVKTMYEHYVHELSTGDQETADALPQIFDYAHNDDEEKEAG